MAEGAPAVTTAAAPAVTTSKLDPSHPFVYMRRRLSSVVSTKVVAGGESLVTVISAARSSRAAPRSTPKGTPKGTPRLAGEDGAGGKRKARSLSLDPERNAPSKHDFHSQFAVWDTGEAEAAVGERAVAGGGSGRGEQDRRPEGGGGGA
uniref:Uncharacterized protein n=1 Tax=Haptolina brevifila TaxID=156173 RepID=A0A7S2FY16_9EUKA